MACALSPTRTDLDSFLDCALCLSTYKAPKGLPCMHSFCYDCLEQYLRRNDCSHCDHLICPLCRHPFIVPREGVAGLPTNFFINSLIEHRSKKKKEERRSMMAVAVSYSPGGGEKVKVKEEVPSSQIMRPLSIMQQHPNSILSPILPLPPPILPQRSNIRQSSSNSLRQHPSFLRSTQHSMPQSPNILLPLPRISQLQQPSNISRPAQNIGPQPPITVPPPSIIIPPLNLLPSPPHVRLPPRLSFMDEPGTTRSGGGAPTMVLGFAMRAILAPREQKLVLVNLATPNKCSIISCSDLPVPIGNESAACIIDNDLYAVGIGQENCQLWKWSSETRKWAICSNLPAVRRQHSVTSVGKTFYVLGGWESIGKRAVDTIYSYDTTTNSWKEEEKLKCAVNNAAAITRGNSIYLFGGYNKFNSYSNKVQQFEVQRYFHHNYTYVIPSKIMNMKAVQWKDKIILLGSNACYVYAPGHDQKWENRDAFKTGQAKFGLTIHGDTLYTVIKMDEYDAYQVEKMEVANIIQNKCVPWKRHSVIRIDGDLNLFCTQPLLL